MIVLYILLFIFCLSVLIMIHELGHLTAAKLFNVYCFEYSIGMGPALFRKKRKNGETYFAIRAFPFGGFVSMYGEDTNDDEEKQELPDGIESIPPERSLANIKKWKRAIILVAGVTMNAVLALVLFFIASALPQQTLYLRQIEVKENSIAYNAGFRNEDILCFEEPKDPKDKNDPVVYAISEGLYPLSFDSVVTYNDDTTEKLAVMINTNKLSFKIHTYDSCLRYFVYENDNVNYTKEIKSDSSNVKNINIQFLVADKESYNKETEDFDIKVLRGLIVNRVNGAFEETGLGVLKVTTKNNFGQMVKKTFTEFGESSILIGKALGGLFIGKGWKDVGGIISIYTQTTNILTNYDAAFFIRVWGIISVNLAIVNLLPFPGLDGWQLLVLAVEATVHKEIPKRVKSIISIVGISLLMVFMVLIIIKDIIGLF